MCHSSNLVRIYWYTCVHINRNNFRNLQDQGEEARKGKAEKFTKLFDQYMEAATCLETMAGEILNLPIFKPYLPFRKYSILYLLS